MASHRAKSKQMAVEMPARKRRAAQRVASVTRLRPRETDGQAIPGWSTLSKTGPARKSRASIETAPKLTTARYALWLTGLALSVTLYVGHVHATQRQFETVHMLKKDNLRLHLRIDQLRGELDRTAGPAVLYPKARRLGLKEGATVGPVIRLED